MRLTKLKKQLAALFLAAVLALFLAGCSPSDIDPQSSNPPAAFTRTELNMALSVDPDGLDPHRTAAASTFQITNNIYDTLVKVKPDGSLIGGLAEKWDVSADGMSITFHLRDNVKFHNGVVCDADAVVKSFERLKGEGSPRAADYANFTVTSKDSGTVLITLGKLDVAAISSFAYPWSAVVEVGAADTLKNKPVGTGPFTLESWIPQQSLTLAKNPDYYSPAKLEIVNFKMMPDATARISAFRNGELDIIGVGGEQVASFVGDADFELVSGASNALQLMAMNLQNQALSDVRVRQAINYAVDKQALIDTVWFGYGELIGSHFPTVLKEYVDNGGEYAYDVSKAKQLLKEAGFENGLTLEMYLPKNYSAYVSAGQVIADSLKEIGITCNIHIIEWAAWLSDVYAGRKYDLTVVGHTGRLDPYVLLARYQSDSGENYFNYSNEEVDRLLNEYKSETGEARRTEIVKEVQEILAADVPAFYIQTPISIYVARGVVAGFTTYPIDIYEMKDVYFTK